MRVNNLSVTQKMCHARPGDVIEADGEHFLLICIPERSDIHRQFKSSGLHEYEGRIFLANLKNGEVKHICHLSSQVIIHRGAEVSI